MLRFKPIGTFCLGFVVGGILVGGLIAWRYSSLFRDQYYSNILEVTNTAYMIRAGREAELVNNAEANIQQCIASANSIWGDNEARLGSFWYAQRYYQEFNLDVPAELQPIFESLPPRPLTSCERNKSLQKKIEPNKAENIDEKGQP